MTILVLPEVIWNKLNIGYSPCKAKPHTLISTLSKNFSMPNIIIHMETMNSNHIIQFSFHLKPICF